MNGNNCFYEIERRGETLRIILNGEMDHHNAVAVRTELDSLIAEERPAKFAIDLSGVGFMDSSGLGFVMGRYSLIQKLGGEFVLENPNDRIMKIFELAGLGRMIRIESTKKEDVK
ncbi:MAG: STAS domain-containing protein [Clostridia bacterium]|nr:STAS domain-containing protein [Clostridia bacterium]